MSSLFRNRFQSPGTGNCRERARKAGRPRYSGAVSFSDRGDASRARVAINVDRTEGKPITRDLFWKSKQQYTQRAERVDILGVYSETHAGIFMPQDAAIHIHFISHDSAATGHIDALVPGSFTLRLPRA